MNRISTRTHGIIDYSYAASALALGGTLRAPDQARQMLLCAGLATLGSSLCTRYELGAFKVLPMKAHLALDAVLSSALISAPWLIPERDGRATGILRVLGVFGMVVGLLTDRQSPQDALAAELREVSRSEPAVMA